MWRLFAYLTVPVFALSAAFGIILAVWGIFEGNFKGAAAMFVFVVLWSWAGISAYKHEIKHPKEEKREICGKIDRELAAILAANLPVSEAISAVAKNYTVSGHPRHRTSTDSRFHTAVELETKEFTIWLYVKDGVAAAWDVT